MLLEQAVAKRIDRGDLGRVELESIRLGSGTVGNETRPHFVRGFFGERDCQDALGRDLAIHDQPADTLYQYPRLAGPGACNHANVAALPALDSPSLIRCQLQDSEPLGSPSSSGPLQWTLHTL